jgi:hypothetical protein
MQAPGAGQTQESPRPRTSLTGSLIVEQHWPGYAISNLYCTGTVDDFACCTLREHTESARGQWDDNFKSR